MAMRLAVAQFASPSARAARAARASGIGVIGAQRQAVAPAFASLRPSTFGDCGCTGPPRPVLRPCRGASSAAGEQFEKQLMPEDILQLRAQSMVIMQDPVCELRPEEVQHCVVQHSDPVGDLPFWHPRKVRAYVSQPFRNRQLAVQRFNDLIIERLDNEPLLGAFDIDTGFNMQVYFMILHAWLLHQRLVLEGPKAKKLDENLFEGCWTLVRNWMWLRKIPEYRFDAELQNVQEYMLGCCMTLDKALERPDILPARIQQALWANIYSGSVKKNASGLTHLTKYCLRQLGLMLQLEAETFLTGSFVWADFRIPDDKPRPPLQLPVWRQEFSKVMKDVANQRPS